MPEDLKKKIMASRGAVISLFLLGCVVVALGVFSINGFSWAYMAVQAMFAIVWTTLVYGLAKHPLFVFTNDSIEIRISPLFPARTIRFGEIKDICKSWDYETKIVLANDKKIHLPVSFLAKADSDYVFSEIKKRKFKN